MRRTARRASAGGEFERPRTQTGNSGYSGRASRLRFYTIFAECSIVAAQCTVHSMRCMFTLYWMGPVPIPLNLLFSSSAVREHCCPEHAPRLTLEGYALLFTTKFAQAGPAHPADFATSDWYRFGSACHASGRGRRRVLHAIAVTAPELTSLCWTPIHSSRTEHSIYCMFILYIGWVPYPSH